MDKRGLRARVAYAMIEFAEDRLAPNIWHQAIRESLVAGTWVERYGRRWYMAQWNERDQYIIGKLAFEFIGEEPAVWDADQNDVRTLDSLAVGTRVQVVPFVLDLGARRAAFELRSQTVRPGTFQGNLQALLAKASSLPWRVTLEGVTQPPWDEWSNEVSRLTALWISMWKPNPHSPIPEIEELWDKPGVKSAQIVVRGTDVPIDAKLIDGGIAHAFDYGKISAEAILADGHKASWTLAEEGGVRKDDAERDESGHVSVEQLQRLLRERAREDAQPGDEATSE